MVQEYIEVRRELRERYTIVIFKAGGSMKKFKIPRKILLVGLLLFLMIFLVMSYLYIVEKNRNANMLLSENSTWITTEGSSINKEEKNEMYKDAQENALGDVIAQ